MGFKLKVKMGKKCQDQQKNRCAIYGGGAIAESNVRKLFTGWKL